MQGYNTMGESVKFKNRNLFDYLKNILKDKDFELYEKHIADDSFETDFKKFMELRYLSMSRNPSIRKIIMDNQFIMEKMDCKNLYKFLITVIPVQNNHFISYIK